MDTLAPAGADTPTSESYNNAMDADADADLQELFPDDTPAQPETDANQATTTENDSTSEKTPLDEADAPQDAEIEGLENAENDPQGEEPATLEPPARWDAQGRDVFAKMPIEAQEYVALREKELQGHSTRQAQELAQVKLDLHEAKTQPDTMLSELIERQTARMAQYAHATPENLLNAVNDGRITPQDAQALSLARQQEETALSEMKQQAEVRQTEALNNHVKREMLSLQAQAPKLAEQESLNKVMSYLKESGVSEEQLTWIDARSVILADKARQFDELQAARAKSKPAPVKVGKPARSAPADTGNQRAALISKLKKSGKPKDIERLLDMQSDAEFDAFMGADS